MWTKYWCNENLTVEQKQVEGSIYSSHLVKKKDLIKEHERLVRDSLPQQRNLYWSVSGNWKHNLMELLRKLKLINTPTYSLKIFQMG